MFCFGQRFCFSSVFVSLFFQFAMEDYEAAWAKTVGDKGGCLNGEDGFDR